MEDKPSQVQAVFQAGADSSNTAINSVSAAERYSNSSVRTVVPPNHSRPEALATVPIPSTAPRKQRTFEALMSSQEHSEASPVKGKIQKFDSKGNKDLFLSMTVQLKGTTEVYHAKIIGIECVRIDALSMPNVDWKVEIAKFHDVQLQGESKVSKLFGGQVDIERGLVGIPHVDKNPVLACALRVWW